MDQSQDSLIQKHLTAKCPHHNMKVTTIYRLAGTNCEFCCKLCKPKDGDKAFYLADILDDDILALIEQKIQKQLKDFEAVNEKKQGFITFLDNTISAIKKDLDALLDQAREKIKKKFEDFLEEKKAQEVNWVDLKNDFEKKKMSFLQTPALSQTEDLSTYLNTYSKLMEGLASQIEAEKVEDYEVNREEITKFRMSFQNQVDILSERLVRFNFSNLNIKIEEIKEEAVISSGQKAVFKALTVMEDLNMFATGSTDGELAIWDCDTLKQIAKFKSNKTFISSILYIPQKKLLVVASLDRTIKVYAVSNKKINNENPVTLSGHKSFIYGLCYLEDINAIASVGHDADIRIWNADKLTLDFTISTNGWGSDSYEMIHLQEEGWIGVVGKDVIRLYSYRNKSLVHEIKTDGLSMQSIQYLKKEKIIVAAVAKGKIRLWRVQGGSVSVDKDITFEDVGDTPYTILALEEQGVLAVTTRSKFVCFIKISDGTLVKRGTVLKDGIAVAVLKNQAKMIVADNASDKIVVFKI